MAELNLRAYIDYISDRLSRGAYAEVVAQCRHVLETYPKYVECYKLLGRALVEQGDNRAAVDVFQRVLSCDPNDYTSHVGISNAFERLNEIDAAIWHLERAYEQVPGNTRLEDELRNLIQIKTGTAPRQIRRTSGALARLYARGGLYQQAIPELRKALRRTPERLDLKVLLALVLWDAREPMEAGQVAAELLRVLPNSIDANRILASLWMMAEQPDEARPFINRLSALDPYTGFEVEYGRQAPVERFRIVRLERTAIEGLSDDTALGQTDWLDDLDTVEKKEGVTGPLSSGTVTDVFAEDDDVPDWLQEAEVQDEKPPGTGRLSDPRSVEEILADENDSGAMTAGPMLSGDEPDWLRDALMEETPTGLRDQAEAEDDTPDWLRDVLGEDEPEEEEPAAPTETAPAAEEPAPLPDEPGPEGYDTQELMAELEFEDGEGNPVEPQVDTDIMPEWLRESMEADDESVEPGGDATAELPPIEVDDTTAELPPLTESPEADDDMPDWMRDMDADEEPEPAQATAPDEGADDESIPEWLRDVEETPSAVPPEQPVTPLAAEADDDMPDWMRGMDAGEEPEPAQAAAPDEGDNDDVPSWLSDLVDDEEPSGVQADAGLPDWFDDMAEDEDEEIAAVLAASPAAPTEGDEAEVPAWLAGLVDEDDDEGQPAAQDEGEWLAALMAGDLEDEDLPPVPAPAAADDGIPDWLTESPEPQMAEPAPADDSGEDEGLPEWLKGASDTPTAPPPTPAPTTPRQDDDLPEWLKESASASEQARQPAAPAPSGEDDELPAWLRDSTPATPPPSQGAPVMQQDTADDDELPAWLREDAPAAAQSQKSQQMTPPQDDELPAWLAESGSPTSESEQPAEQDRSVPEEVSQMVPPDDDSMFDEDDTPDWLTEGNLDDGDAAMAWLNEIAAKYDPDFEAEDASAPDEAEEEPAPEPVAEAEPAAEDDLPDWLTDEGDDDQDDLPDWLKDEPEEAEEPAAPVSAASMIEDDDLPDWLAEDDTDAAADEDMPAWLADIPDEDESAPETEPMLEMGDDDDDDMPDWLREGPSEDDIAEMEGSLASGEDDLPDWLAEDDEEEPAAEEEPAVEPEPEPVMASAPAEPEPDDDDDTPDWLAEGNLDDEEAAMAWLNEIAAKYDPDFDSGAQAEAEEEVTEPEAEAIAAVESDDDDEDMPDWLKDVPEAEAEAAESVLAEEGDELAWLDEQAAAEGVEEGELVTEALEEDKPPTPEMPFIPDPEAKAEEASEDDMPDWLKDVEPTSLEDEAEDELVLELEDDDEDLETALDDIFGDTPESDDELDAIFAAEAVGEAATEAEAGDEEESTGLTGWLTSTEDDEEAPEEAAEEPVAEEPTPEPAEGLPTWMGSAVEEEEEDDLAAFLRATEPAKTAPLTPPTEAPEAPAAMAQPPQTSELSTSEAEEEPAPEEDAQPEPAAAEATPLARPPRTTSMLTGLRRRPLPEGEAGELVSKARKQIEEAEFNEALETYERLIVAQQSLDVVVGDLQNLMDARPNPRTRRVLGDALMMQGNLEEALAMYRTALDEL